MSPQGNQESFKAPDLDQLIEDDGGEVRKTSPEARLPGDKEKLVESPGHEGTIRGMTDEKPLGSNSNNDPLIKPNTENSEEGELEAIEDELASLEEKDVTNVLGDDSTQLEEFLIQGIKDEFSSFIQDDVDHSGEGEISVIEDELASLESDHDADFQDENSEYWENSLIQANDDEVTLLEADLEKEISADVRITAEESSIERDIKGREDPSDESSISSESLPMENSENLIPLEDEALLLSKLAEEPSQESTQDTEDTIENIQLDLDRDALPIEDSIESKEEPSIDSDASQDLKFYSDEKKAVDKNKRVMEAASSEEHSDGNIPSEDELIDKPIGGKHVAYAQDAKISSNTASNQNAFESEDSFRKLQTCVNQVVEKSLENIVPALIRRIESAVIAKMVQRTESILTKQLPELVDKIAAREIERIK